MANSIFREKSLKKISSPDELNEYVRVANPGIWILLVGVILLLLGFIAWGYFGRLDSVVNSFAIADNTGAYTYVKEDKIDEITNDSFVVVDDKEYKIKKVSELPVEVTSDIDAVYLHIAGLNAEDWAYIITFDANLNDGVYEAKIVTERVKPISLLFE